MTSPTTNTMYDDLEPFFGTPLAKLFVALNYRGTNFSTALNAGDAESLKREQLWQLMLAKNYVNGGDKDNVVSKAFIDFVKYVGQHHKELVNPASEEAKTFKSAVCGPRFASLHPDAQTFLNEHVNAVNVNNNTQAVSLENPLAATPDYRVNLKQVDWRSGDKVTKFCATLPETPEGTVDQTNNPVNLCASYKGGLAGGYLRGGAQLDDAAMVEWQRAGLNVQKFIKGASEAHRTPLSKSSVSSPLDLVDLGADVTYSYNPTGELVRKTKTTPSGTKVEDVDGSDCYSTQIKNCDQVYPCLLSGNKQALKDCFRKFANEGDLFKVAHSELSKVHPSVINQLLATFHVSGGEHYTVWLGNLKQRLVSELGEDDGEEVHKAILNNNHLLNYIRGLIDIARASPSVFSRDTQPFSDMDKRELKKSSKIKYFYRPTTADSANLMPTMLDSLLNQLRVLPQNLAGQYSALIGTQGVIPGMALPLGMGVGLRGGARKVLKGAGNAVSDTVKNMRAIYQSILNELNNRGKDLVSQDKKKIEDALNQLEENNTRLEKTLRDLQAFVRLNKAVDVGISKISRREYEGLSDDNSVRSLKSSVSNLESCLGRVTRDQVGLMTSLVDQVLRPMALLTIGAPTSHLRVASS